MTLVQPAHIPLYYRLTLEGECSRCGLCCSFTQDGQRLFCEYLDINDDLGQPMATSCRIWSDRTVNMPIRMINEHGDIIRDIDAGTTCCSGTPNETRIILDRGIGRGCSLTVRLTESPALSEMLVQVGVLSTPSS